MGPASQETPCCRRESKVTPEPIGLRPTLAVASRGFSFPRSEQGTPVLVSWFLPIQAPSFHSSGRACPLPGQRAQREEGRGDGLTGRAVAATSLGMVPSVLSHSRPSTRSGALARGG